MDKIIAIITTVDSHEAVERISRTLLEERLITCAQVIGPITSVYWWKDRVEQAQEWLALMKTRETLYEAVERRVREMHPYELPEIVAFNVERGLPGYLLMGAGRDSYTPNYLTPRGVDGYGKASTAMYTGREGK